MLFFFLRNKLYLPLKATQLFFFKEVTIFKSSDRPKLGIQYDALSVLSILLLLHGQKRQSLVGVGWLRCV